MANIELESPSTRTRHSQREPKRSWLSWGIPLVIWAALILGSYFIAVHYIQENKDYLDQQIQQLELANQQYVNQLNQSIALLQYDLEEHQANLTEIKDTLILIEHTLQVVQDELSIAEDALGNSDQSRVALGDQINRLNRELDELRKSIQKLEEAARVY